MKWIYFVSSAIGAFAALVILRLSSGQGEIVLGWGNSLILLALTAVLSWLVGWLLRSRFEKN